MTLNDHPTARHLRDHPSPAPPDRLDGAWLRDLALQAGADDVAVIPLDHPDLEGERRFILEALPGTQALVCVVVRMARAPVRSPTRSVANGEFHRAGDRVGEVGDAVVHALERLGVAALHPSVGFPMEMDRFPGRTWVVSHKIAAQAAGLGRIGLHRNLIHPEFGSFILLTTVLVGRPIDAPTRTLDYNPCADCRLCVAACPVGAIQPDGRFDFAACLTHNYREFMGGFSDWVGTVAESEDRWAYRARVGQAETASWWQSLTSGPHYKAAYCVAACPAGSDVMGELLRGRKRFVQEVVEPLRAKVEPIYVLPDSDAEAHVRARYPHKQIRRVEGGLYADSIPGFLRGAPLTFQARKAREVRLVVSFRFTGPEACDATFRVDRGALRIVDGLADDADVTVTIDGALWLDVLRGRRSPVWLVLTRRMRIAGDRRALDSFQACFPGRP
jgi:Fe-S-cluster-containing hydrogenase component 2